jgi:hypothetical protein
LTNDDDEDDVLDVEETGVGSDADGDGDAELDTSNIIRNRRTRKKKPTFAYDFDYDEYDMLLEQQQQQQQQQRQSSSSQRKTTQTRSGRTSKPKGDLYEDNETMDQDYDETMEANNNNTTTTTTDGNGGANDSFSLTSEVVGFCKKLLNRLSRHKESWPFVKPVNPVEWNVPDYFDIIRNPMDLGTITVRLKRKSERERNEWMRMIEKMIVDVSSMCRTNCFEKVMNRSIKSSTISICKHQRK